MAFQFKFPDLGEGIHEGRIVRWLVGEGQPVKLDQTICEVETDKAVVEVPSPAAGTLIKQYFPEGQVVHVGQYLCAIGAPGEAAADQVPPASGVATPQEKAKVEVIMPPTGASPSQSQIYVTIHGDRPQTQEQAGVQPQVQQPSQPMQGAPITQAQPSLPPSPQSVSQSSPSPVQPASGRQVSASPATRQLARDMGIDINLVNGTGPGGRVTNDDVKNYASQPKAAPAQIQAQAPAPAPISQPMQIAQAIVAQQPFSPKALPEFQGPVERIDASQLRKAIARKMADSAQNIPQVTHMEEADVTELWAVRESQKKAFEQKTGTKLTLLPFISKAMCKLLAKYPSFNSSYDALNGQIVRKKYCNLGFAVDTPDGLLVVVVKQADSKGITQLDSEVHALAQKARERKASLDDMQNSTFTITNIGSYGGVMATPLINYPESAILGLYRMRDKPVVKDGVVVVRKVMPFTITFDHRLIDGGEAARFASELASMLENPQANGLSNID